MSGVGGERRVCSANVGCCVVVCLVVCLLFLFEIHLAAYNHHHNNISSMFSFSLSLIIIAS